MKEFLKSLDNLPLLVKLILCIPAIHIVWGVYRIISALDAGNVVALIIHIILLFIPIMWIVDIFMILLTDSVLKLA